MRWLLLSIICLGSGVFIIGLASEMKEEEGIAGITGCSSIIDAKVKVGSKMLPEVTVDDAVMVKLDRGAMPEEISLRGTELPLPLAPERPATKCWISVMVTG